MLWVQRFLHSPAGKHGNPFMCLRKETECSSAWQSHTDAGTKAFRLPAQVTLMQTLVTSLPTTYFHVLSLLCFLLFPADHVAIYFQQRAYDLSFMFIGHRNGMAEGSWERLNWMGSPLLDRRAGNGRAELLSS